MASATPPQRILHVTPSFFPAHRYGGPVATLHELGRAQVRAGLEVKVLTSDAAGDGERLPGLGGRWVHEQGLSTFYARVALGEDVAPELVRHLPALLRWADLVHVTGVWNITSQLGLLGAVAARRPCVLWPCGALLPWALGQGSRHKQRVLRLLGPLLRRVGGWHTTSDEEAAALGPLGVVGKGAAIRVVPNGVTIDELALTEARTAGAPRVVVLGRIHPVKNLELAIQSLAELRRHPGFEQTTLTLAGPESAADGYGDRLRALARAGGVEAAVRFPGLVTGEAKGRLLRDADVLWLCSHMESFGNVVGEALAAGTPVVAARTTPWRMLDELGCGRWAAPTAGAFVAATRELAALELGPRCQAVATRFAWPRVEAEMRALYRAAAGC